MSPPQVSILDIVFGPLVYSCLHRRYLYMLEQQVSSLPRKCYVIGL